MINHDFKFRPIGHVSASLIDREHAPKQGHEGAPEAWLVGIHRVRIVEIVGPTRLKVSDLEACDATPIIDVKPVLDRVHER